MSGSRRFPSLTEESLSLGADANPPSGSRLNPTIIEESPTQIEQDECDQWFPLALKQGNDEEEEENGVLERHELHHSPISVASSPAPPEPMSGTRVRPMLVEDSSAPHYIMVEDSLAPQCIVVEESPVPMSGVKDRLCLVVESPESTEDRAGTTSPVPMSGTKDRPSLVDDSPAVPKVYNACWVGGDPVEGGSATLLIDLGSPPSTTCPMEDREQRVLPNWGGDSEVATGSEPVFASHPRSQSPLVVHESPQHFVVDESPPPPPQRNTVGPVSSPPSPRPGQPAYMEHVNGILYLIRPSRGGGSGGGHSSSGGAPAPVAARPTPPSHPAEGPSGPSVAGGLLEEAVVGHLLLVGGGPSFRHSGGPAQTRGAAELKHTCGCPRCVNRCVVHYETYIQSLMAQVQDLRTRNLELQRSQQELFQAVSSTAGISQSYGDQMTQILSTLAKFVAVVQGYQRDSKAVDAGVSDHLKMFNSKTAKCFDAVETLAARYAAVASRIDAWDHWYSTPAEPDTVVALPPPPVPDPEPAAPTASMGAPSGLSGGGCVLPFSVNPSHHCIYHPNACPDSGWPRGGEEHHEHPHHQEPTSRRGSAEKQRKPAIPEWRAAPKGEEHPTEPRAPWTSAKENTSSSGNIHSLTKNVFTSPGNLRTSPLILRTRVQFFR